MRHVAGLMRITGRRVLASAAIACLMGCAATPGDGAAGTKATPSSAISLLLSRANAGDKQAQLELGKRYETGDGVPVDRRLAYRWYRRAAADAGGKRLAQVPALSGNRSQTVVLDAGPYVAGSPEARERLKAISSSNPRNRRAATVGFRVTRSEILTGRLRPAPNSNGDETCRSIAASIKFEFGSDNISCSIFAYELITSGGQPSKRVYTFWIGLDPDSEYMRNDGEALAPGFTVVIPYNDKLSELCGRFRIDRVMASGTVYDVIIGPVNRMGGLEFNFKGEC